MGSKHPASKPYPHDWVDILTGDILNPEMTKTGANGIIRERHLCERGPRAVAKRSRVAWKRLPMLLAQIVVAIALQLVKSAEC